ncbi:hypothetical protein [Mangrovimonas xylaniphaga]|uniref:hypothetical protein n=1 Tax=Mangrovimonas xylaniphaga TaxID=1645915 RepID=UPI0006B4F891|nr:hypothetical protein [Mangrovimonas xylaniphaga]
MKHISYILILIVFIGCKSENKKSDFEQNIKTEKQIKSPIIGKWKVIKSNVEPFQIISNGKKLYLNTIFEFSENGKHQVYEKNKSDFFSSVTYRIDEKKLIMVDLDMVFEYGIESLTTDSLKLKIKKIPTYFWTDENLSDQKVQDKIAQLQKGGVLLELEKIKNGG